MIEHRADSQEPIVSARRGFLIAPWLARRSQAKNLSMNRQSRIMTDLKGHLKELVEPRSIVAVYLFGSHARNEAGAASDMDLAFLLDQEKYISAPYEAAGPA